MRDTETKLQVINFVETTRKQDGRVNRRVHNARKKGYSMPAAQSIPRTITSYPLQPIALP